MITEEEKKQYSRQIMLSEIGEKGQARIKGAKVLVIGAGGLGSAVLQYLGAAGVGHLGIVDGDIVSQSNLQRQTLYSYSQIGKTKVDIAKERLRANNPYIDVTIHDTFLSLDNAMELIASYDIVVDCTDNFSARYLINDATVLLGKPWVYGSIYEFLGQISVFNFNRGATYRCLYPEVSVSQKKSIDIGVVGAIAGWVGAIQANQTIKMICGVGEILSGKLLLVDALWCTQRVFSFSKNEEIKITSLEAKY